MLFFHYYNVVPIFPYVCIQFFPLHGCMRSTRISLVSVPMCKRLVFSLACLCVCDTMAVSNDLADRLISTVHIFTRRDNGYQIIDALLGYRHSRH